MKYITTEHLNSITVHLKEWACCLRRGVNAQIGLTFGPFSKKNANQMEKSTFMALLICKNKWPLSV